MKYNFEVDNFSLVSENHNSQFATIECDICRSGMNTHRMPISRDAIESAVPSVEGKPILAAFNFSGDDFAGHEWDEQPVGFFEANPELIEKDNELYLRAKGKIWKRYFGNVMDIFKTKGGKTDVSMEMEMLAGREPTPHEDGVIDLFSLMGCTLLGVRPAIQGSEARVLSFSEMMNEYDKESQTELEKFSEERRKSMAQNLKVNKTELKTTAWGSIDKTAMRNKIMEASNKASLVKAVYAVVESGWQDAPSEHLKYPLMQLVGDTFYYNRGALSSALAYAKQENEQSVISKVESLYKKFKLDGEGEKMAEDIKKEMAEDIVENTEEPTEEKMADELAESTEEKMEDVQKEMSEEEMEDEPSEEEEKEDVEDGEGDDEKAEDFSEGQPSFAKSMRQVLDCATEDERMACKNSMQYADEDENIVMEKVCEMCGKMAELEQFKANTLQAQTEAGVANILASVKASLSKEDFAELEEKSKTVEFEGLDAFKAQAKAFAFDHMTEQIKMAQEDGVIRMGLGDEDANEEPKLNVFERIMNK